jgi:MoxR-like ATPase
MEYKPKQFKLNDEGIWLGNKSFPSPYLFSDDIAVALDVALVVERPLLIAGPPGSGKSMLAQAMAGLLDARFMKHTLTSRSRLEDLTGGIDQLARLHDANAARQGEELKPDSTYLRPGLFWKAFSPEQAARYDHEPATDVEKTNTVILLDEIDKAEPDLPNDLLEVLDAGRFTVPNGPEVIADSKKRFLVFITTNGERELPPAFVRRCVSLVLPSPDSGQLQIIGGHHCPDTSVNLREAVAKKVATLMREAKERGRRTPGTSEFIDALKTCAELSLRVDSDLWAQVEKATLIKGEDGH